MSQLLKECRWEVVCLEECKVGVSEWEEFEKNICWRVICGEIKARDAYITQCLRLGDASWTDDQMRGRLNELEFVLTIPQAIMTDVRLSQQIQKTNNGEGEE